MDFKKTRSEEEEERAREPSVTLWCEGAFILFYCAMMTDKIVDWPTVQRTLSRSLRPKSSSSELRGSCVQSPNCHVSD